jgi:hypothetical protein
MVNTTTKNDHFGTSEHTIEALNEKYINNYRLDIDFVAEKKPTEPGCGHKYFKLKKIETTDNI